MLTWHLADDEEEEDDVEEDELYFDQALRKCIQERAGWPLVAQTLTFSGR